MSLKIHAFYGAQYLGDEADLSDNRSIPDGSYLLMNGQWYHKQNGALSKMQKVDLPPETQAQLMLLGIQA